MSEILLEMIIFTQLLKHSPSYMESIGLLLCLEEPVTRPYTEANEFSPQYSTVFHQGLVLILSSDISLYIFPSAFSVLFYCLHVLYMIRPFHSP